MGSQYELPENGRIRVLSASGSVTVIAEERSDVEVEPANRSVELKESGRHRHRRRYGIFDRLHRGGSGSESETERIAGKAPGPRSQVEVG